MSKANGMDYVLLKGNMENGNKIFIRTPISPIEDSAAISNRFIYVIGFVSIVLGGFAILVITERFTKPIEELNDIANEMTNLNFKRKYRINDSEDEIDELGKSINILSDKLEETILQLKKNNSDLERDIEAKSKIDEMRKQFISDVSHELKTPIALIQGYAEGLVENVTSDEESRKFYTEVILDEANKMDKLVKRLLELMKLEYEDRKFNDTKFDIVELINEVIRNSQVMLKEQKIEVEFNQDKPVMVFADDFYIEQVITNYFTNAIKNNVEVGGQKRIKISIKKGKEPGKMRVTVFNTGKKIDEENLNRIWTRFYKVDESRNRSKGGTGIGLALVKAIMTKYKSQYGVTNKKDGVEFYFEIAEAK
jgi:signal transduction histidine kinase